jgi:hypothetical protein
MSIIYNRKHFTAKHFYQSAKFYHLPQAAKSSTTEAFLIAPVRKNNENAGLKIPIDWHGNFP